jgi:hypothetical protein
MSSRRDNLENPGFMYSAKVSRTDWSGRRLQHGTEERRSPAQWLPLPGAERPMTQPRPSSRSHASEATARLGDAKAAVVAGWRRKQGRDWRYSGSRQRNPRWLAQRWSVGGRPVGWGLGSGCHRWYSRSRYRNPRRLEYRQSVPPAAALTLASLGALRQYRPGEGSARERSPAAFRAVRRRRASDRP